MPTLIPPREHPVVRRVFVQELSELSVGVLFVDFSDFRYHLAPRLIPLPVTGLLVQLLYHTLSGGTVLQRKLGYDTTQLVGLGELDFMQRNPKPEAKFIEAVHNPSMDFTKHHNTFGAVSQKLRHSKT